MGDEYTRRGLGRWPVLPGAPDMPLRCPRPAPADPQTLTPEGASAMASRGGDAGVQPTSEAPSLSLGPWEGRPRPGRDQGDGVGHPRLRPGGRGSDPPAPRQGRACVLPVAVDGPVGRRGALQEGRRTFGCPLRRRGTSRGRHLLAVGLWGGVCRLQVPSGTFTIPPCATNILFRPTTTNK